MMEANPPPVLEEEAGQEEDVYDPFLNFLHVEDEDQGPNEDLTQIRHFISLESDKTWFEVSKEGIAKNSIDRNVSEEVNISNQQMKKFTKDGSRKTYYQPLITNPKRLDKLIKDDPERYKRCQLQIESAHRSVAKVLDKGSKIEEIVINGRSKCGQTFNEDEVVVEVSADPRQREVSKAALRTSNSDMTTVKKHAEGRVIGLIKRIRYTSVDHPVLVCTLDENEGHFMKPLCKTVPTIRVLNDTVREQYPALVKSRIEIKEIASDGSVQFKCFLNVDPDKRKQYVFKVAIISWKSQDMYPLGVVLNAYSSGGNYAGSLELLAMQHRIPKVYSCSTVSDIVSMLQEGALDMTNRKDLRDKQVFTIDQLNSKDLELAFSIWKSGKENVFVVGVHIADVAAWVKKGSPTDMEAQERGVSFYPLEHKPHHMLPEPLSIDKCSLLPNETRLTISIFFTFDECGKLIEYSVEKTVIKSKRNFSYAEVQTIINNGVHEENDASLCHDIRQLHKISSQHSTFRKKNSRYFQPFADPRLQVMDRVRESLEAHALKDELIFLTNFYIAERVRIKFPRCMILQCQKAPPWEELVKWKENEKGIGSLVMQLQDTKVTPGSKLSLDDINNDILTSSQHHHVIVQKAVMLKMKESMKSGNLSEARKLAFMDALHPLQYLANQHWMELMDSTEYKCSHGLNQPDHIHFGLNLEYYTTATSPIRRYVDLHVQRLLHADLDAVDPDCTSDDVMHLCRHINNVMARQKSFEKGCESLKIVERLQCQPLVFRAFVDHVDTQKLTLSLPSLAGFSEFKQEIPFSILGVCSQPFHDIDHVMKKNTITVKWNKHVYNEHGVCNKELTQRIWIESQRMKPQQPIEISINPHQLTEYVKLRDWAKMLKMLMSCDNDRSLEETPTFHTDTQSVNYMSSEKGDGNVSVRQCNFKMKYSAGQLLQVQMTSEPTTIILRPRVELVQITRNVNLCLTHVQNPVSALSRSANRATRNQKFTSFTEYVCAWMPLLEMEGAYGAGDSDNTTLLENVKIRMCQRSAETVSRAFYTGTFELPAKFCFDRGIGFGLDSLDDFTENYKCRSNCCVGYLCIRYQLKCDPIIMSRLELSDMQEFMDDHYVWVGHARITEVEHKSRQGEDDGQIHVRFVLNSNSPQPPYQLTEDSGDNTLLEILPVSEVDKRTQQILLQLGHGQLELAQAIAYGEQFTNLPSDHLNLGSQDIYHEIDQHLLYRTKDNYDPATGLPENDNSQSEAIQKAMKHNFSLIQGPPGTGKTYTGIKLVYLFNKINRKLESEGKGRKVVLFCGPSNKCVDLVGRLLKKRLGKDCPKILRIYGSSIESKDYPLPRGNLKFSRSMRDLGSDRILKDVTLHHVIRESGKKFAKEISDFEKLFKNWRDAPEQVTSKQIKDYQRLLYDASVEEISHYDVILTTCAVGGSSRLVKGTKGHIFQLIIDECAMSPEPHTLTPIIATKAKQVVLIGDHKQLRPIIKCQPAAELGLDQSLFERLYGSLSSDMRGFLNTQYRMHPEICQFPSEMFYDGKLMTGIKREKREDNLSFWPRDPLTYLTIPHMIPHILVDVRGEEETLTVSSTEGNERSKSNRKEAEKVVEIFKYLKSEFKVDPTSMKVMTQYNAQRNLLEKKLHALCEDRSDDTLSPFDKGKISVTTVVSSQGGEWDYVIFSTVRSLPSCKIEPSPKIGWCRKNLGFITDRNQINVALTRARYGLIIVGNMELLNCDTVWKKLIERYKAKKCIRQGEDFPRPRLQGTATGDITSSQQRFPLYTKHTHASQNNPS